MPGMGVTKSCEPPCGCWESNQVPLKEQLVLLTAEHLSSPKTLLLCASVSSFVSLFVSKTHYEGKMKYLYCVWSLEWQPAGPHGLVTSSLTIGLLLCNIGIILCQGQV